MFITLHIYIVFLLVFILFINAYFILKSNFYKYIFVNFKQYIIFSLNKCKYKKKHLIYGFD